MLKKLHARFFKTEDSNHSSEEIPETERMWHMDLTNAYILTEIYKEKEPPIIPKDILQLICYYFISSPNEALYHGCYTRFIGSVCWALKKGAAAEGVPSPYNMNLSHEMQNIFISRLNEDLTPLHYCVLNGYHEIAKTLLNHNSKIIHTKTPTEGSTYLQIAANNNDLKMCELLLSYGCEVNSKDKPGRTALIDAAEIGSTEIVKLLIENNVDVNMEGRYTYGANKKKAISYCLDDGNKSNYFDVALILIKHGANANDRGIFTNRTLLHYAAAQGNLELVQQLIECEQADLAVIDFEGKTPLKYAMEYNRKNVVDYLQIIAPSGSDIPGCECIIL